MDNMATTARPGNRATGNEAAPVSGHGRRPNVVPITRGTAALAPTPEPEPTLVPVMLDWEDLRGPAGPHRIFAPDAPAAWRGQVTLTVGVYAVTVPDAVVDTYRHGPPLADLYLTDDQFRALIGRKLDQQTEATP